MTLRGPAHPDTFRVQVGRYGDRFYCDPLPACDIAPATDDQWPSVSIVKNAWPKNLGPWMASEAARFAVEHRDTWVNLPADAAVEMIAKASDRSRNAAADRGTEVHRLLENIAAGQEPDEVWVPDAVPYLPVLRQLVADLGLTPESFVMAEAVCISRTLGYGGTADAVIRVGDIDHELAGKVLSVDWKSRKPGRHDAYRDECAQLAAYTFADYMIIEVDGQATRAPMPKVDGGLIVSITPDDYRLYPVDMHSAWRTFTELRGFHDTTKRKVRGSHVVVPRRQVATPSAQPEPADPFDGLTPMADAEAARATDPSPSVAPVTPAPDTDGAAPGVGGTASPERWAWARQRLVTVTEVAPHAPIVWPEGVVSFREARESGYRHTDDEIDAIVDALAEVEARMRLPFPDPDPGRSDVIEPEPEPAPAPPSPRVSRDDPRVTALVARLSVLPPDLLLEIEAEAVTARGIPAITSGHATEEHLVVIDSLLGPREAIAEDRAVSRDLALSLCQANGCEPITALHLVAPDRDADRLTEWEVAALDDLAIALASGAVVGVDNGKVVCAPGAEDVLVEIHGGRREVLAAARQIAKARHVKPGPSSTSDVLADPVLAAAVEVADRAADVA